MYSARIHLQRWFPCALFFSLLLLAALPCRAQQDWRSRVSAAEKARINPLAGQSAAAATGRQLYLDKCARCHAADLAGSPGRPSLRTERTASETDGEFYWILKHGVRWRGMPSWGDLPDDQLWQLVAYLRSQQAPEAARSH